MKLIKTFDTKLKGSDEEVVNSIAMNYLNEEDCQQIKNNCKDVLAKVLVKKQKTIRFSKDEEVLDDSFTNIVKNILVAFMKRTDDLITEIKATKSSKNSKDKESSHAILLVFDNIQNYDLESLKVVASVSSD